MTAPLVPADADLRDFHFMPLDVARLINSDLAAIATGDEFKAAVILWCKCWHQVPASSLPDDDRMLAHLAGLGRDVKAWKKLRNVAIRGFVSCDDGRLYHPVIAEKVNEAMDAKRRQRHRTAKATQARTQPSRSPRQSRDGQRDGERVDARDGQRDDDRDEQRDGQRDDARNVHQGTGIREGEETRARDPDAELERKLREAAGWQSHPAPKLHITGEIQALIDNGADLSLDVLPVVKLKAPKCRHPHWGFFVQDIAEQRDRRIAAATVVSMPTTTARNTHAARSQKPTRAETFDAIRRRIDEIAASEADSGTAPDWHGSLAVPDEGAA